VSNALEPQRKRLAIAMTEEERHEYLGIRRMCRLATVNSDGAPHVSPLWFVWDGENAWIYSIVKSQRWVNITSNPRVALVVDDGHGYEELRGVEITGRVAAVGEIPRTGAPEEALDIPERLFSNKYSRHEMTHDGRHAWLCLVPEKIVSWDFTKLAALK
jgi:nitroimidazol reductase NimA-like FMN-containing flavoprotein (pyridoxamine 5'-phosphate oxidase superfamily)